MEINLRDNIVVMLRGVPGTGKSTWLQKNQVEDYAISLDKLRLLLSNPIMLPQGYYEINQKVSEKAWKLSYELLKSRMKNGGVTFFDATFMSKYLINYVKDLARQYRYETLIINFNSVGLDEAKRRNAGRWGTIRYVPDYVLDDMWSEGTSVTIEGINVVDYKDVEIIHFK